MARIINRILEYSAHVGQSMMGIFFVVRFFKLFFSMFSGIGGGAGTEKGDFPCKTADSV